MRRYHGAGMEQVWDRVGKAKEKKLPKMDI
jgi:hypothetical protein